MRTYLAKRLLLIVPTLFGVAAVVFLIMRVIPGDVTLLILGGDQTGRIDPQHVRATIGKGGRRLTMRSGNGDVEVDQQSGRVQLR